MNPFTPMFSLNNNGTQAARIVEVPEFGHDEDGRPFGVHVIPITVKMRALIHQRAHRIVRIDGKMQEIPREDTAGVILIAAMCARDENGRFVFGATYEEAVERVESLPGDYAAAIVRISEAALSLSSSPINQPQISQE